MRISTIVVCGMDTGYRKTDFDKIVYSSERNIFYVRKF